MGSRAVKGGILWILLTGLIVRLAWGLSRPADVGALSALPDQLEYLKLGENLASGKGLSFYDPTVNDTLYAYRMPGYPLFVAACGAKVQIIRVVQSLLDVSSVFAIYLIARRWLGEAQGQLAGAIVALNPFLIFFSALVLSETMFVALLAWGMWLMLQEKWRTRLFGAILLVGSIYARPSAMGLPVMVGVLSALARVDGTWTGTKDRWRLPIGASMILLTVVMLLPWAMRNQYRVKSMIWTTTNSGFTAYDSFNPYADGSSSQKLFRRNHELGMTNEVGRSNYLSAMAWEYARQNPARVIQLAGQKLGRFWSPVPLSAEYGSNRMYWAVGLCYSVPLFVLTLVGLLTARVRLSVKLFLLAPAIYFTLVHAVFVGSLRYRIPAEAPMAVLGAAGASALWMKKNSPPMDADEHG